jgi:hypothetical protein
MALRKPLADPAEPLVRVADVLAEVAGVNPSRMFDEQAERVAAMLAKKLVSRDWAGRPVIPAMDAERLLWSMRRDLAEQDRDRAERVHAAELEHANRLPAGTIGFERPGEEPIYAPGVDLHRIGRQGITSGPGGG